MAGQTRINPVFWISLRSLSVADLKIAILKSLSNCPELPNQSVLLQSLQEIGRSYAKYRDLQLNCKVYV